MFQACASSPVEYQGEGTDDLSVLIVEDEAISRRALASILTTKGYNVQTCATAEDALEYIREGHRPKVVLVDVDLPGMTGLELISRMERMAPGVFFHVLTTASSGAAVEEFRRARSIPYLQKPLDLDRLMGLITRGQGQA